MVDYSRFEKIVEEEIELERREQGSKVKVTRLEKPTQVTIKKDEVLLADDKEGKRSSSAGGKGLKESYSKWDRWAREQLDGEGEVDLDGNDVDNELLRESFQKSQQLKGSNSATSLNPPPLKATIENLTLNGSETDRFFWSQTADEICIRVKCAKAVRAKDVRVELNTSRQLKVTVKSDVVIDAKLLNGVWDDNLSPFSSEDEKLAKSMSWEMEDAGDNRCIVIRLHKRPPHEGVKMWWRRVFTEDSNLGERDIDVEQIASRSRKSVESMRNVWNEAHKIFLANRQKEREDRERISNEHNG